QLKSMIIIIFFAVAIISIGLIEGKIYQILASGKMLRDCLFQVVSIFTSTGFITTDFDKWPNIARFLLVLLMFIGGCAGSTCGGLKQIRLLIIIKIVLLEFQKLLSPHRVTTVKVGSITLERDEAHSVVGFFVLYLFVALCASAMLMMIGLDIISAISAVFATLGNVGPALGAVSLDYHSVHPLGKWILSFCMLAGRLELFCVLIIPFAWTRQSRR
ncbi:MAG: potassium transporter TrkG, partial [Planctomycetota bacterium]|nr:potassium transporter TrkG [Planctomycetota bacterium]